MHVAVLIGLVGFIMLAFRMLPSAMSEMEVATETKKEDGIIQASSLKSYSHDNSAGLLLVFVILCVVSFINARKEWLLRKSLKQIKRKKFSIK